MRHPELVSGPFIKGIGSNYLRLFYIVKLAFLSITKITYTTTKPPNLPFIWQKSNRKLYFVLIYKSQYVNTLYM
jgi:hypothetical protein